MSSSETDLSEVLQIEQVFTNVTKGQVAKKEDWVKSFAMDDMSKVIEEVSPRVTPTAHTLDSAQGRSTNQQLGTLTSPIIFVSGDLNVGLGNDHRPNHITQAYCRYD